MGVASDKFLSRLKDDIDNKIKTQGLERDITNSSFVRFVEMIEEGGIHVSNIKDFTNREISFYCDVSYPGSISKISDRIVKILTSDSIENRNFSINRKRSLIHLKMVDLSMISGNFYNNFFVEIHYKNKGIYLLKFFKNRKEIEFSLVESKRNNLKFWTFSNEEFDNYEIKIKSKDPEVTVVTPDNKYQILVNIFHKNETEIKKIQIFSTKVG
jgi:hypothetical protein